MLVVIEFASIIGMKSKMGARFVSVDGKPNYEIDAFYLVLALALVVLGAGVLRWTRSWASSDRRKRFLGELEFAEFHEA